MYLPTRQNKVLTMDLLNPSSMTMSLGGVRTALFIVDCLTRLCYLTPVVSHSLTHLGHKVALLFKAQDPDFGVLLTDLQFAFATEHFVTQMTKRSIRVNFSPRDQHHIFNPITENQIRSLECTARAGLTSAHLTDCFWFYAVSYVAFWRIIYIMRLWMELRLLLQLGCVPQRRTISDLNLSDTVFLYNLDDWTSSRHLRRSSSFSALN